MFVTDLGPLLFVVDIRHCYSSLRVVVDTRRSYSSLIMGFILTLPTGPSAHSLPFHDLCTDLFQTRYV